MEKKLVEVEGQEMAIFSTKGIMAIIPKNKVNWVKKKLNEGCHECIDEFVKTLPDFDNPGQKAENGIMMNTNPPKRRDPNQKFYDLPKEVDTYMAQYSMPEVNIVAERPKSQLNIAMANLNPKNWFVKDYSDYNTRDEAFAAAKTMGEKEFMYNGKRFNTKSDMSEADQMRVYGITDQQRMYNPGFIRKNLSNLDTDLGYDTPLSEVAKTAVGLNEGWDLSMFPNNPIAKEQDALRLYMGLPQKANTFSPSKYKKGAFELNGYLDRLPNIMPSDEEIKYYGQPLRVDEFIENKGKIPSINVADTETGNTLKPLDDFVMGRHTVKKGKDNRGEYIEYMDKFDFDTYDYKGVPVGSAADMINKPFDIYGRKYYKDYGDGQKRAMYYTDKELLDLDPENKNFDTLALQRELSNRGYQLTNSKTESGDFDGVLGSETKKALEDWKAKKSKK